MRKYIWIALAAAAAGAQADTQNMSAETYVESGHGHAGTNFGAEGFFQYGFDPFDGGSVQRSLLRFDLSAYTAGDISEATLRLPYFPLLAGSGTIEVRAITSAWDEFSVTWNDQPTTGTTVATFDFSSHPALVDLTAFAQASAGGEMNIELRSADETLPQLNANFAHDDSNANLRATLLINPVPEPATMAVLGLGLAGIARRRRRG